jgi:hypothetical protein
MGASFLALAKSAKKETRTPEVHDHREEGRLVDHGPQDVEEDLGFADHGEHVGECQAGPDVDRDPPEARGDAGVALARFGPGGRRDGQGLQALVVALFRQLVAPARAEEPVHEILAGHRDEVAAHLGTRFVGHEHREPHPRARAAVARRVHIEPRILDLDPDEPVPSRAVLLELDAVEDAVPALDPLGRCGRVDAAQLAWRGRERLGLRDARVPLGPFGIRVRARAGGEAGECEQGRSHRGREWCRTAGLCQARDLATSRSGNHRRSYGPAVTAAARARSAERFGPSCC